MAYSRLFLSLWCILWLTYVHSLSYIYALFVNLANLLIPEEKVSPTEMKELKALKNEALKGECIPFEEVLKKHGTKRSA